MADIKPAIEEQVKNHLNLKWIKEVKVNELKGINLHAVYDTNIGKLFVKWNTVELSLSMFESEANGLDMLRQTGVIRVPVVYKVLSVAPPHGAALILEYIEDLRQIEKYMEEFGTCVARLHLDNSMKNPPDAVRKFGSKTGVFFGPLFHIKENTWYDKWEDLFVHEIMEPLLERSMHIDRNSGEVVNKLWLEVKHFIPSVFADTTITPSLLVLDLCSANSGETDSGPVLFDPCCMYGHSEFDLTEPFLTNDFKENFYKSYFNILPKQSGFETRMLLYKTFGGLLNHIYGISGYIELATQALQQLLAQMK